MPILLDLELNDLYEACKEFFHKKNLSTQSWSNRPLWSLDRIQKINSFNENPVNEFSTFLNQKRYELSNQVRLQSNASIVPEMTKRRSRRFKSKKALRLHEISHLLLQSTGAQLIKNRYFRKCPSGGKRYPLEFYVLNFSSPDLINNTIYHFNILDSKLHQIKTVNSDSQHLLDSFLNTDSSLKKTKAIIFIFAVPFRSNEKYLSLAQKLILLEAGHFNQNIWLVSEKLKLNVFPVSAIWERPIFELFGLNYHQEQFINAIAIL